MILTLLLGVVACLSVIIGARPIPLADLMLALRGAGDPTVQDIVWSLRIPRTVVGLVVGAALGVCGALIQAYTRNPLADPGILGVNAGAGFAITIGIGAFGVTSPSGYVWFAFGGALAATVLVYLIGNAGRGAATPAKLTLAGVAIAAVLGGVGSMLTLKNRELFASTLTWSVGSIGGRSMEVVGTVVPFVVIGLVLAFAMARPLNALALGDDLGQSLGVQVQRTRILTIASITLLAGGATAIAGPIAFVGLMVPHAVRWFTGPDQRWIVPYSIVAAAVLLLVSDILGRLVLPNGELAVGLVTAFVGAPVLVVLVRRRKASGL